MIGSNHGGEHSWYGVFMEGTIIVGSNHGSE